MRVAVLISICLVALCAAAQNKPTKAAKKSEPADKNALFNRLSDQFLKEQLAMNPTSASEAGYHKHRMHSGRVVELDAELDDFSPGVMRYQAAKFYPYWQFIFADQTPVSSLGPKEAADWQLVNDQIALQLLELNEIQNQRHNPTRVVETIGSALFLPLTQNYAPKEVRVGHVLARMRQIPRALGQAKELLLDSDPIFIEVAKGENDGNVDTIENDVKAAITPGSKLGAKYKRVAPEAIFALKDFSMWLGGDLSVRSTRSTRTWRLGKDWYAKKFRYSMETSE